MSSVNKVIILGNLGADPETRSTAGGAAVTNLSIATSERWKDKQTGEMREQTEWHRVVLFGRTAEIAGQYLSKGSKVYIEGRLQTRKWQDRDGNDRWSTEIVANELKMLGGKQSDAGGNQQGGYNGQRETERYQQLAPQAEPEDDIPF